MRRLRVPIRKGVLVLGALFVLQGGLGVLVKLAQGRSDDLAHNALHLASGLLGLALALGRGAAGARAFALGFGAAYLALGLVGWAWTDPSGVLPLGPVDHVFHVTVGALALGAGLVARRAERGMDDAAPARA